MQVLKVKVKANLDVFGSEFFSVLGSELLSSVFGKRSSVGKRSSTLIVLSSITVVGVSIDTFVAA